MALVTARPINGTTAKAETTARHQDTDADLQRAKDLLELHAEVKVAHQDGTDKELNEARETVSRVLRDLSR